MKTTWWRSWVPTVAIALAVCGCGGGDGGDGTPTNGSQTPSNTSASSPDTTTPTPADNRSSSLVGTWVAQESEGGFTVTVTFVLTANGRYTLTGTVNGFVIDSDAGTWTATATQITGLSDAGGGHTYDYVFLDSNHVQVTDTDEGTPSVFTRQ